MELYDVLILLVICYIQIKGVESKSCSTSDFYGAVLDCFDDRQAIEVELETTVKQHTTCIISENDNHVVYKCINGTWTSNTAKTSSLLKTRRKRGWFSGVVDFFVGLFGGGRRSRDTTPPKFVGCPDPQTVLADPVQVYARAYWKEPEAHDNKDGRIVPTRHGLPSGHRFHEGGHTVTYVAKNRRGNSATCEVKIHIQVVRCHPPSAVKNGYYLCHPSTDFRRGGSCRYGCYDGFDLDGDSVLTCQDDGSWSSSRQPMCKPWKCPTLPTIEGAEYPSCTQDNYFRSICTYNCKLPGYDMPPNVAKTLVCSMSKTWRKSGNPRCIDIEPPAFETCPSMVVSGTDSGVNTSHVVWKDPMGKDNSNKPVKISLLQGQGPNVKRTAGTYQITYGIQDETGNVGKDCQFSVIVRDVKCTKIYPTPYVRVLCPRGYRTGSFCNISCDPGKTLSGDEFVSCDKSTEGMFGKWNWQGGTQSKCTNNHKCVAIKPPKNGALVCDNWIGGEFCQAQCRNGTEMPSVNLGKLYVCDTEGDWKPTPMLRQCTPVRTTHRVLSLSANFVFDGDCTDPMTQNQIAQNFIQTLKNDIYFQPEACPDNLECNANNVQVFCGAVERKKRSTNSSQQMDLQVRIRLPVSQGTGGFLNSSDRYMKMIDSLSALITENITNIIPDFVVNLSNFTSYGIRVSCPKGSVQSEESLNCVDCPPGSIHQESTGGHPATCKICEKGTYQSQPGRSQCHRCPHGTTTRTYGSVSYTQCEEACSAGSYSFDGLPPCSLCEIGHYQHSPGKTSCRRCPAPKTTNTFGATSIAQCQDFDINFYNNGIEFENTTAAIPLNKENVQLNELSFIFWARVLEFAGDNPEFQINFLDENGQSIWTFKDFVLLKSLNVNDMLLDLSPSDKRWHLYLIIIDDRQIHVSVDGFTLPAMALSETCVTQNITGLSMHAGFKTSVTITNLNIWRGLRREFGRKCDSTDSGDILSWQDMDDAELDTAFISIRSECDDYNNCASMPCVNGACEDKLNDFVCKCDAGYTGRHCDVNIDDCEAHICMNNSTCVDGVAGYTCSCKANYTGKYCETEMVDGQWSEWGNWSECSKSCGEGIITRTRLCNSPTPDNGGQDCPGKAMDMEICNVSVCPVCVAFPEVENGTTSCVHQNQSITCVIECIPEYDFDIAPMEKYICGQETFHVWNFETTFNPKRRLPKCVETQMPEVLGVHLSVRYKNLHCVSEDLESVAKATIQDNVNSIVSSIPCVTSSSCSASDVVVTSCDATVSAKKKVPPAGFSIKLTSNPSRQGGNHVSLDRIQEALMRIKEAMQYGKFNVDVLDDNYEIDENNTLATADVICGPGQTSVDYYCVPCGTGSYLSGDDCEHCWKGSYQDKQGQVMCLPCPDGTTTLGEGSDSLQDCSVSVATRRQIDYKVIGLVVGIVFGISAVMIAVLLFKRYRSMYRKSKSIADINMYLKKSPNTKPGQSHRNFQIISFVEHGE